MSGDCEDCGYWSSHLEGGTCPLCRERYSTVEPIAQPAPDVPMVTAEDA